MAAGFVIGLVMAWAEKSDNKDLHSEVTLELAKFCTEANTDLRPDADKVVEMFSVRRFKLEERTPDTLVFSYPSYMHGIMSELFVLIFIVTLGGALGFAIAFVFSGTWPEKIKVDLAPTG